ncbi:hypothetical protein ACFFGH_29890 [Lysobacter korlensis]|uniref:Uncharacterized protein n=1 Tax=Lysobacter korlensis TaxID=553636 RepID=A0ABV6RYM0_9GAMM
MELVLFAVGALVLWAVSASMVGVARDGYCRVPTRSAGPADSAVRWH